MTDSKSLLTEFSLAGKTLKNRVVMAPLTRGRAGTERIANDLMAEYYGQRASAGMIVAEATVVSEQGIGWIDSPGIYNDAQVEGWKKVTGKLQETSTPVVLQLWHCGRASHSSFHGGELPVSASAVKIEGAQIHTPNGKEDHEVPRALETSEVEAVVRDFAEAARRAADAGFDGIEIHSANGYLLNQFLESKTNHRTDRYGGSLENRLRLLGEVIDAVLEYWPKEKVGVRLSPNGNFNDMGSPDYRETCLAAAKLVESKGLGFLHVVDGLGFGFHDLGEAMVIQEFREVYRGCIIANCSYTEETAETAIAGGHADLVAFGRPYISNPDLVERFAKGLPLAEDADTSVWSSSGEDGYTTFPRHPES